MEAFETAYVSVAPAECREEKIGIQRYDADGKTWIHVMNYRYDEAEDRVQPAPCLRIRVPDLAGKTLKCYTPEGVQAPGCTAEGTELVLRNAGLYTIVELD